MPRPLSRPEHPERLSLESTRPRLPGTITGLICPRPLESREHPGMDPGLRFSRLLPALESVRALSASAAPCHWRASRGAIGLSCSRPHALPAAEACSWPVTLRGYRPQLLPATVKPERPPVIPAAPGTVKPERPPVLPA